MPRESVVRLTDRPNMTLDVYRGRKTTTTQQQQHQTWSSSQVKGAKSILFLTYEVRKEQNRLSSLDLRRWHIV